MISMSGEKATPGYGMSMDHRRIALCELLYKCIKL